MAGTEREHLTELKVLLFAKGLMGRTLKGEKQISLRKYKGEAHDFEEGEWFIAKFEEGLDVILEGTADTEVKTFNDLTDEEAKEDGFENVNDAFEKMHQYYPNLQREDKLGIIRFKVATLMGTPVVSANENFKS